MNINTAAKLCLDIDEMESILARRFGVDSEAVESVARSLADADGKPLESWAYLLTLVHLENGFREVVNEEG